MSLLTKNSAIKILPEKKKKIEIESLIFVFTKNVSTCLNRKNFKVTSLGFTKPCSAAA